MNNSFVTGSAFNRFTNLDNIEWKVIDFLVKSKSKYANYLWKVLKYNTEDCLSKEDLTEAQKRAMIYTNNGDAAGYRVFMGPFVDDAYEETKSSGAVVVLMQMLNIGILLSANLGVMNLLPFPALDGGRLVFLIIEAIRGKRVPPEKEGKVHLVGMILLLALMAFVLYNDIVRMF